jgi:hypothetical protein
MTEADWVTTARDSTCAVAPKTQSPSIVSHILICLYPSPSIIMFDEEVVGVSRSRGIV